MTERAPEQGGGDLLAEVYDWPPEGRPEPTPLEQDPARDDTTPIVLEDLDVT